jgi:hypothetical protein
MAALRPYAAALSWRAGDAAEMLDFLGSLIDRVASPLEGSRWLPLTLLTAFSFALFYAFQVLLQIYSLHPVIVFVLVGGAPPHP